MRITLLLLLVVSNLAAQKTPEIFQPGLISNGGVFGFTLSPDGKEAFWVQSNGGRDTLIIMHSMNVKGKWQQPTPASFSGNAGVWKDIDPVFSPDGKTILFQSNRPVEGKPDRTFFDIWISKREKNGWSKAIHLGNVINTDASESFASMTKSGNIYFMKDNPDGKGSSDIWVSKFENNQYKDAVNLGAPVNTTFRESNPFVSPNEDYIIYFSSDSTGLGDVDLFISFKHGDQWSKPKSLGSPINGKLGEFCPFYHERQKKLYFCRTVTHANGRRTEDIFVVDFDPAIFRN
ncbi:TolB family protein [Pseudochryseolinea flava]|nr:PD40 domain-containing protein [Pseudochryseolinea flava]